MAHGHAIRQRMEQLRQRGADIPEILIREQEIAILRAVDTATKITPPNDSSGPHGTGTITGQSKAHWATDSQTKPTVSEEGDKAVSKVVLANNLQHMSYLNDGHKMDMHFVPGLIINPYNGLLEKVDPSLGGIVVGTQTKFVRGLYMREAALASYRGSLDRGLYQAVRELSK